METTLGAELYRIGAAATDVGMLEWVRRFVSAAGLVVVFVRLLGLGRWMQIAVVLLVVLGAHAAQAQPVTGEDEAKQRPHFPRIATASSVRRGATSLRVAP